MSAANTRKIRREQSHSAAVITAHRNGFNEGLAVHFAAQDVGLMAAILLHGLGINSLKLQQSDVNLACSQALNILRTAEAVVEKGPVV